MGMSKPKSHTGFKDSKGILIKVGDNGKYNGMEFHVIEKEGRFYLEKWCKVYDLPLDKESAQRYTITEGERQ